jgi:hypothetical protein
MNELTNDIELPKRLATVKEACAHGKIGKSALYVLMKDGTITAYRRDSKTLIDMDSVDAFNRAKLTPWQPGTAPPKKEPRRAP